MGRGKSGKKGIGNKTPAQERYKSEYRKKRNKDRKQRRIAKGIKRGG